ncbi:hypothetical protein EJ04DRAFT_610139 [Polyplosphaeria fusca]|uniref:Uncharacterized protein n=1 Tax=Polyplosphaeria fusca TaxID=682080 RepID=A0A9P4QUB1_9PLEO|nr:hypothetical protein EJ04DRAFT_610139 [Polyplosphaeria fusca]
MPTDHTMKARKQRKRPYRAIPFTGPNQTQNHSRQTSSSSALTLRTLPDPDKPTLTFFPDPDTFDREARAAIVRTKKQQEQDHKQQQLLQCCKHKQTNPIPVRKVILCLLRATELRIDAFHRTITNLFQQLKSFLLWRTFPYWKRKISHFPEGHAPCMGFDVDARQGLMWHELSAWTRLQMMAIEVVTEGPGYVVWKLGRGVRETTRGCEKVCGGVKGVVKGVWGKVLNLFARKKEGEGRGLEKKIGVEEKVYSKMAPRIRERRGKVLKASGDGDKRGQREGLDQARRSHLLAGHHTRRSVLYLLYEYWEDGT